MISGTVITQTPTDFRKAWQAAIPLCVIYARERMRQSGRVLTTKELLARLRAAGVKNAEIARTLNITASRVTELYNGDRALKLDEAVKLANAFDLDRPEASPVPSLPGPVCRLIVDYIARDLGSDLEANELKLESLAEDIRAFAEFVTDPQVRGSIDLAMTFFQAMRLRRPVSAKAD